MKRGFILFFLLASFLTVTGQSTGKYQIKFLEINKNNSDYGVAILDENKLVFTSADEDPGKERNNYNARKDLYVGDIDYDGDTTEVLPNDYFGEARRVKPQGETGDPVVDIGAHEHQQGGIAKRIGTSHSELNMRGIQGEASPSCRTIIVGATSEPRLYTVTNSKMSSGPALAYSTNTSK